MSTATVGSGQVLIAGCGRFGNTVSLPETEEAAMVETENEQDAGGASTLESVRPMGQLVLRLNWVESGEEDGTKKGVGKMTGHTTLVVHGACGLAKADL